jgi:hypothetical protein
MNHPYVLFLAAKSAGGKQQETTSVHCEGKQIPDSPQFKAVCILKETRCPVSLPFER